MKFKFYEGLDAAYLRLETLLNSFRTAEIDQKMRAYNGGKPLKSLLTPIDATTFPIKLSSSDKTGRVVLPLGEGYACKASIAQTLTENLFCLATYSLGRRGSDHAGASYFREERNQEIFRKYGLTLQNGFYVPEHRVVGLKVENGLVRIDPEGTGVTITEDLTEGGLYVIRDVQARDFWALQNAAAFLEEYKRHMDALDALYKNPNIDASVNRHGASADPTLSLSRMLLIRIDSNIGSLVLGDLDNIAFEEKTQ